MIVLAVLITPSIANAQETPELPTVESWAIQTPEKPIYLGDTIDLHITGTPKIFLICS